MTDRELLQRAVKSLPSLAGPLLGTLLVSWLATDILPRIVLSMVFDETESMGFKSGLLFAVLVAWILLAGGAALLRLGAFRLCLDRGEGKVGAMPWTILSQWRRYIGWVLWTSLLSVGWRLGGRIVDAWAMGRLDYRQLDLFFSWRGHLNLFLTAFSFLLTMLLALSVQTAYLRAPERGFWRAVGFGVGEGLRRWPKTIGGQLKFVVPVLLGIRFITVLLSRLVIYIDDPALSWVWSLSMRVPELLAGAWTMVFYGFLAAERYAPPIDGPKGGKGPEGFM